MHDYYLLLTPLLTLLVVALAGFVGCDLLFGLDHVPDEPTAVLNLQASPDNNLITLTWEAPTKGNPSGYMVKRGEASGNYTINQLAGNVLTFTDTLNVVNGTTYYYTVAGIYAGVEKGRSNEVSVVAGYTGLNDLVTGTTLGNPQVSFGLVGMGFTVASAPLVVKTLGRFVVAGNAGAHKLKLVDAASKQDVPGGSVTVNLAGHSAGDFAYGDLTNPVTLNAGADYYLVSEEMDPNDQSYISADTKVTTTNVVTRVYAVNGDFSGNYNTAPINDFVYGPVDLQY